MSCQVSSLRMRSHRSLAGGRGLLVGIGAGALPEAAETPLGNLRSPAGRYAVYAYPRGDVWQPASSKRLDITSNMPRKLMY